MTHIVDICSLLIRIVKKSADVKFKVNLQFFYLCKNQVCHVSSSTMNKCMQFIHVNGCFNENMFHFATHRTGTRYVQKEWDDLEQ